MLSSYHTHSKYSDGKNTLEEMVQSAIEMGCLEIGFSDHAPMTIECEWCMNEKDVPSYKNEILALKEKYKDKIKIYVGTEQDYFSTPASGYDYILGSVHYVYKNGEYLPVDLSGKAMEDFVNKHYNECYIINKKIDIANIKLQEEEVADIKYFSKEEILARIANNYEGLTEKTGVWNFLEKIFEMHI